ncbi:hypothetical protein [Streptomyces sp. 11x1]|uniref:hypothetical protein n=1 Tax=Streptomyces sp. 11x1 TaxID=3038642 RepID=UPI00292CD3D6|nr:hypothetical protein [Streptomyces sp. 11x1]WNZ12138.1 hypothetical protein P8T65_34350 [Streptomyces sp. 11x1]
MPLLLPPDPARRLALYALVVCLLAITAAVVSFSRGSWLGVVWVLMAGLSSNMTWYYVRKARQGREAVTSR